MKIDVEFSFVSIKDYVSVLQIARLYINEREKIHITPAKPNYNQL